MSGALANKPFNGGAAWTRLSWTLGLERLGFEVFFIEELHRAALIPGESTSWRTSRNITYFDRVMSDFGLDGRSAVVYAEGDAHGLEWDEIREAAAAAAVLVNLSGNMTLRDVLRRVEKKIYVDLDPGHTQFWHTERRTHPSVAEHDLFYSLAQGIGSSSSIPDAGLHWLPIRQPVVLEDWPIAPADRDDRFTTVASWRGALGRAALDGRLYGLKAHEFRKVVDVPRQLPFVFEIALEIDEEDHSDRALLEESGWRLVDPRSVAGDPASFRDYVQRSGAEFSCAQGIYVETRSGWFSDRTTRYLASGKPALVQDTGFGSIPVGEGLLSFRNARDAISGARAVVADYARHSAAARRIAEEWFDSDRVLEPLVDNAGVAP